MTSPDKKYPDLAFTRFRIHSLLKNLHSGERIQKVADSYAGCTGCVWTKADSAKKNCGFNQIRIRVDGAHKIRSSSSPGSSRSLQVSTRRTAVGFQTSEFPAT